MNKSLSAACMMGTSPICKQSKRSGRLLATCRMHSRMGWRAGWHQQLSTPVLHVGLTPSPPPPPSSHRFTIVQWPHIATQRSYSSSMLILTDEGRLLHTHVIRYCAALKNHRNTHSYPEGEVLIAGGLWPVGIAHESSVNVLRNYSYSYDVMRKAWAPLPLPPFEPGRTQGACLPSSLVIISGGDGGNVGSRVMRLSKPSADQQWRWDTSLPSLPPNAARFTAVRAPPPQPLRWTKLADTAGHRLRAPAVYLV